MPSENLNLDVMRSSVNFWVRHLMVSKVHGRFTKWHGSFVFEVTGDLTMRGVTKPVTLDVEYAGRANHPQLGERFGFSARGVVNRKEWGLKYHQVLEAGGLAVSDKIEIQLEIQATKGHTPRPT
jgi:polyisoprenoid-binding protein YceI